MTLTVTLPQELERLVAEMVEKGLLLAPEEALIHGLYLLKDEYALHKVNTEELRQKALVGLAQAERGEVAPLDFEAIKAKVRERLAKQEESAHAASHTNHGGRV